MQGQSVDPACWIRATIKMLMSKSVTLLVLALKLFGSNATQAETNTFTQMTGFGFDQEFSQEALDWNLKEIRNPRSILDCAIHCRVMPGCVSFQTRRLSNGTLSCAVAASTTGLTLLRSKEGHDMFVVQTSKGCATKEAIYVADGDAVSVNHGPYDVKGCESLCYAGESDTFNVKLNALCICKKSNLISKWTVNQDKFVAHFKSCIAIRRG